MAGTLITQQQVNLYMSYRKNPKHSQVNAAAKASFSERTALLQPITLFEVLIEKAPDKVDQSYLRTLQRKVKRWRAKHGREQEVIFLQRHIPGVMGISDYTWMNKLKITLAGELFEHKLYDYRLVYSGWTYVQACLGADSFESLPSGLQNAFWRSGGVPAAHRTDSLSGHGRKADHSAPPRTDP